MTVKNCSTLAQPNPTPAPTQPSPETSYLRPTRQHKFVHEGPVRRSERIKNQNK